MAKALAMQFGARQLDHRPQHSADLSAYRLFLKGRHERYTTRNFIEALRNFDAAIELDPQYARARVGAAETSILLGNTGYVRPRLAFARAETELTYATALGGQTAETLAVQCFLRAYEWDWDRAEEAGRHAVEIDPSLVFARSWLSMVLSARGRCEEAAAMAESVVSIDPLSHFGWVMSGWALNAGRRFEQAEAALRRALDMNSGSSFVLWHLGIALEGEGKPASALTFFERAHDVERGSTLLAGMVAWGLAAAGRKDEARAQLTELEERSRYQHVPRYPLAWTFAALGDTGAALIEYERALGEREPFLIFPLFPGNEPFRHEARFTRALEQMGLTWALSAERD